MFRLKFLDSYKKTIIYLAIIMAIALLFFSVFIAIYSDAYYTCCSDDLLQYFKMQEDFITKIKSGNVSFYNYNNYLGASMYSDTYYVPLDLFTVIVFILSFFMNFELAFGITEVIKLFLGTLVFAYFLRERKMSNKAIFVTSLIYFICGYNSVMMAFSSFFSLVFYYPFAALCLEKFKKGENKVLLPLCSALLVFYNFYLGACVMLFMAVWFILSYFIDNKIEPIKANLLKLNPNQKHVRLKAFLIYLKRGFQSGIVCALYMIIGIMIASIILLPSISFFLTDSYSRTENFYKWSFNSPIGYNKTSALKMYMRILGNLFTPTYSTDFYAFINDYITDHNSLYITITGLIILLFVFRLKDRESRIYKVWLAIEVLFLAIPIFYMLFSLNGCPYTRWFGMLNIINLLIVAHVINRTDFKFNLLNYKSLITNIIMLVVIVFVINYYIQQVFNVNLIGLISGKKRTLNTRLEDMVEDIVLLVVAIGIIVLLSTLSMKKVQKHFNIMPYVLTVELVIGFCWMFGPKVYNYNTLYFSDRKGELNSYMDSYLEIPYGNNFSRTYIKSYITDDYVHSDNYSRTNLHLSDLRVFHSFYDCNTNELAGLLYDNASKDAELRNSKLVINEYSLFVHELLANRYVVVDSTEYDYNYNMPEKYFTLINDDGQFKSYENINYKPFVIYDTMTSMDVFTNNYNQLAKQQIILNYCLFDDDFKLDSVKPTINTYKETVYYKDSEAYYDEEKNMVRYDININGDDIPQKGIMHFYFDGYDGARCVAFGDVELEYSDGRRENALSGYAYYEEIPKSIWIYANGDFNDLSTSSKALKIEYSNYDEYEYFINRMQNYSDQELIIDGNKLHLSYKKNVDKDNVIVLPISYNDCWKIDKDYKIIKANGGLLGIIIPKGDNEINLTLTFKPRYINGSALISICGVCIYAIVLIGEYRRLKKDEEDFNYCTLL